MCFFRSGDVEAHLFFKVGRWREAHLSRGENVNSDFVLRVKKKGQIIIWNECECLGQPGAQEDNCSCSGIGKVEVSMPVLRKYFLNAVHVLLVLVESTLCRRLWRYIPVVRTALAAFHIPQFFFPALYGSLSDWIKCNI